MGKSDLVSGMSEHDRSLAEHDLTSISPDAAKYRKASDGLSKYLSADAEWRACALVQKVLLETRVEFGHAKPKHLAELDAALPKVSPLNISLLEDNVTRHDQLAVLEELGRFVSPETKALLHPGTTSYVILDTARSNLFKGCWFEAFRPAVGSSIVKLCDLAKRAMDIVRAGQTHLQFTSPVTYGSTFAGYALRLADRVLFCDRAFNNLKGKISGIVGSGASVEMVVGEGYGLDFEREVLRKLGLEPDESATQIVQKERLA